MSGGRKELSPFVRPGHNNGGPILHNASSHPIPSLIRSFIFCRLNVASRERRGPTWQWEGEAISIRPSVRLEGRMTSQWSSTLNSIRDGETDKTGGRERERWTYFILDSVDDGEAERGRSPGEGEREEGEEERTCRLGAHVNSSDCDWQTIRHVPGIGPASQWSGRGQPALHTDLIIMSRAPLAPMPWLPPR